ncbi:hypothetical protein [Hoeflea sp.]|uniref:hypothetical protein n=1 Tax=Hoeflea sp. TaxID=1940281 RepID=UPI003B02D02D
MPIHRIKKPTLKHAGKDMLRNVGVAVGLFAIVALPNPALAAIDLVDGIFPGNITFIVVIPREKAAPCAVVNRSSRPNEKMIAGPFSKRSDAQRSMRQLSQCQN